MIKAVRFFLFRVRWGRIFALLFLLCAIDVLFQLGLPSDRTSTRSALGSVDIVSMTEVDIERTLRAYEDSSYIYIRAGDEQYIKRFKDVGITIDIESAKKQATYTTRQKLVPFSALNRYAGAKKELEFKYDPTVAEPVLTDIGLFGEAAPEPARLTASQGRVGVVADIPGVSYDIPTSIELLSGVNYQDRIEFPLVEVATRNELTRELATELAGKANMIVDSPPQFVLDEKDVTVASTTISEWFFIDKNEQGFYLATYEDEVNNYLNEVAEELFIPDRSTQITLFDDQEVTRVEGVSGKVLDKDRARKDIEELAKSPQSSRVIDLGLIDVVPGVTYERTYSKTGQGLQVFLKDLSESRGSRFFISVSGIDDPDLTASYEGARANTSASMYKMYIAYYALTQVESGALSWTDTLPSGRQVKHCFEQMILISSNSCAQEFYSKLGTNTINSFIRSIGLPRATVAPAVTTPDDSTNLLIKLLNAEGISPENSAYLIDLMQRQKFRLSIPAGVSPSVAADKPGYYGQYIHDTAIVYGSAGRYAITIMSSSGQSKGSLAEVAKEVHTFMESDSE